MGYEESEEEFSLYAARLKRAEGRNWLYNVYISFGTTIIQATSTTVVSATATLLLAVAGYRMTRIVQDVLRS